MEEQKYGLLRTGVSEALRLNTEIIEQLVACHDEPSCPAIALAKVVTAANTALINALAEEVEPPLGFAIAPEYDEQLRLMSERAEALFAQHQGGANPPTAGAQPPLPTYYLRHPDGSYSVADPQPIAAPETPATSS